MIRPFAAIVPAIDEASTIAWVTRELLEVGACCVYVVDGGSRDGTPDVAAGAGATVIRQPRRGYGLACRTGADRAIAPSDHEHERIAFLDGDGSCRASDIRRLVDTLDHAEVALGRRPSGWVEPGAMPWHARAGNAAVAALVAARSRRTIRDLPPAKAIRSAALSRLALDADGYGWTVQFVGRAAMDPTIRIREVPVGFRRRRGGRSKVSGDLRASVKAGLAMIRVGMSATTPRPVITLMAKAPGSRAKTRLAAAIGTEAAADLWAAILADSAGVAVAAGERARASLSVMLPQAADIDPVVSIVGPRWETLVQTRPGLPGALVDVFLAAFDRGADRAVATAGDAPTMPPDDIVEAFDRLRVARAGAILGPSMDGGYNLVALRWRGAPRWWPAAVRARRRRRLAARLQTGFAGGLGGVGALESTGTGLTAAGWQVERLASRADIDTLADVVALASLEPEESGRTARTMAWLRANATIVAPDG